MVGAISLLAVPLGSTVPPTYHLISYPIVELKWYPALLFYVIGYVIAAVRGSIDSKASNAIKDDISTSFYRFLVVSFITQARSMKKLDEMRGRTYVIFLFPKWKEPYNNFKYHTFIQLQVFKYFQASERHMSFLYKNISERRRLLPLHELNVSIQIVMSVTTSTSCYNHVFPW